MTEYKNIAIGKMAKDVAKNDHELTNQCEQIIADVFNALKEAAELTRANKTNKPVLKPDKVVITLRKVILPILKSLDSHYLRVIFLTALANAIESYCQEIGIESHNIRPNDIYPFSSLYKTPLPNHTEGTTKPPSLNPVN